MSHDIGCSGSSFMVTDRTKVKRLSERGKYEKKVVYDILDECLTCVYSFCPVNKYGFRVDDQEVPTPMSIPQSCVRYGNYLLTHGKSNSTLMKHMAQGFPVSVAATLIDGVVFARSGFNHSMNYRSVVIYGTAEEVTNMEEKRKLLNHVIDHLTYPGRAKECRPIADAELVSTTLTRLEIKEASAKVRQGPPHDDKADLSHPAWAGVVPLAFKAGTPISDRADSDIGMTSLSVPKGLLKSDRFNPTSNYNSVNICCLKEWTPMIALSVAIASVSLLVFHIK
uniref:Uncharacterized protein n=1 Tax=Aplanochytrium stocchinoi TaxID=215587 RepID=A0A7S3PE09_9STRA|mmetsp:Transcript_15698/g.19458  ORF Transcript_15698/g.19458 Transcript_15698/m.19458 type:complete len:281 (-) Transcript_15698:413-1255(-)